MEWELLQLPEVEEAIVYELGKEGKPTVAAMIYPNWALLHEQGIEPHQALDFIWERIKEAQKNLAVFKRLKRKEAITTVGQPFASPPNKRSSDTCTCQELR